jgi:hypothetical protein
MHWFAERLNPSEKRIPNAGELAPLDLGGLINNLLKGAG